eukprot:3583907-Amphidinium_carterae.1
MSCAFGGNRVCWGRAAHTKAFSIGPSTFNQVEAQALARSVEWEGTRSLGYWPNGLSRILVPVNLNHSDRFRAT